MTMWMETDVQFWFDGAGSLKVCVEMDNWPTIDDPSPRWKLVKIETLEEEDAAYRRFAEKAIRSIDALFRRPLGGSTGCVLKHWR